MTRGRLSGLRLGLCAGAAASMSAIPPGAAGPSTAPFPRDTPAMRCEIDAEAAGQGTVLTGRIVADLRGEGRYRLVVTVTGAGGTSNLRQDGVVSVVPGQASETGRIAFNTDGGRHYEATLTVTFDGASTVCRRSGP